MLQVIFVSICLLWFAKEGKPSKRNFIAAVSIQTLPIGCADGWLGLLLHHQQQQQTAGRQTMLFEQPQSGSRGCLYMCRQPLCSAEAQRDLTVQARACPSTSRGSAAWLPCRRATAFPDSCIHVLAAVLYSHAC